ncbi:ATP-binding domain-containing protein [Amylolactobacillus amylophilus]|nr:ATP-binding domain-containing protein [Amylolactobacillus amylophilus]
MPIYLAKGLEFDSVIAHNVSTTNFTDHADEELIYTIASRALHRLTLTVAGTLSKIVADSNAEYELLDNLQTIEGGTSNV